MNPSPEEVRQTLAELDRIAADTRRAVVALHVGDHFIVWGLIWMAGFGSAQFTGWPAGWTWPPLAAAGMAASAWIGWRNAQSVSSPVLGRIGWFFLALAGFAIVWAVLLHPFNHHNFSVYLATVFMFAYVAGGLWYGRVFVWIGLLVTALAVGGVLFAPQWRDGLMALLGGGALVGGGLYVRRAWSWRG